MRINMAEVPDICLHRMAVAVVARAAKEAKLGKPDALYFLADAGEAWIDAAGITPESINRWLDKLLRRSAKGKGKNANRK